MHLSGLHHKMQQSQLQCGRRVHEHSTGSSCLLGSCGLTELRSQLLPAMRKIPRRHWPRVTVSSDAFGSLPEFDKAGHLVGYKVRCAG